MRRRFHSSCPPTLNECIYSTPSRHRGAQDDDDSDDGDEEDSDVDSEDSEDEDEDDEEGEGGVAEEPELSRAERRELKKKQVASKEGKRGEGADDDDDGDGEDEDELTANPNHVTKKLNISDLSAPRELTRRERYVHQRDFSPFPVRSHHSPPYVYREQKEKKEAKDRYWKVTLVLFTFSTTFSLPLPPHVSPPPIY